MKELVTMMMKGAHEKAKNEENTKAKIEATAYAVTRIVP
jgi:hypothetical protein